MANKHGGRRTAGPGKRIGRPPLASKKVRGSTALLRPAMWASLQEIAGAEGMTRNRVIEAFCVLGIEWYELFGEMPNDSGGKTGVTDSYMSGD